METNVATLNNDSGKGRSNLLKYFDGAKVQNTNFNLSSVETQMLSVLIG